MNSLAASLRRLQEELSVALSEGTPLPAGTRLVAERVVMTIGVVPDGAGGWSVVSGGESSPHQVTVEFRPESSGEPVLPASRPAGAAVSGAEADAVVAQLSLVFGAPGFDSAARATVFRECLEELDEARQARLLAGLGSPLGKTEDQGIRHAHHLLARLATSGPAGQTRGLELLQQLGSRYPARELIRLAAQRWRSQSDWIVER